MRVQDDQDHSSAGSFRTRLYGRGAGRALSDRQKRLMDTLGRELAFPGGEDGGPVEPRDVFDVEVDEVRLEIGFGAGDHLTAQALACPQTGFIGVEFFTEGFAKCLSRLDDAGVGPRVRVHKGDGRAIAARLVDGSVDVVYVLFPDPWPKTRHHKRRMVQTETVAEFARVLRPGGLLRVATDVRSYVDWTLQHVRASGRFAWRARCPEDWRTPPGDHMTTRYEAKNIGDCPPVFLDFERI